MGQCTFDHVAAVLWSPLGGVVLGVRCLWVLELPQDGGSQETETGTLLPVVQSYQGVLNLVSGGREEGER